MGVKVRLAEKLQMKLNLCAELMPGQLLIEIIDESRVLVENHCGVILYTQEEICLRSKNGVVRVLGLKLKLACMSKDQLVITGIIQHVDLSKGGSR